MDIIETLSLNRVSIQAKVCWSW